MRVPGRAWKWLGVAGLAGVAATGVVVARDQRQRRQLAPEEIRDQLHRRLGELGESGVLDTDERQAERPGRDG